MHKLQSLIVLLVIALVGLGSGFLLIDTFQQDRREGAAERVAKDNAAVTLVPGRSPEREVQEDFAAWYEALITFGKQHGRFPEGDSYDPESELRKATSLDANDVRPPGFEPLDNSNSYGSIYRSDRPDGTSKPAVPEPAKRDLWLVYTFRDNVPSQQRRVALLWSDGKFQIRKQSEKWVYPYDDPSGRLNDPVRLRTVWPEEAGLPGNAVPSSESKKLFKSERLKRERATSEKKLD